MRVPIALANVSYGSRETHFSGTMNYPDCGRLIVYERQLRNMSHDSYLHSETKLKKRFYPNSAVKGLVVWCSKKASVPALWLLPINLASPFVCRECVEHLGNYRSKQLGIRPVIPFKDELQ